MLQINVWGPSHHRGDLGLPTSGVINHPPHAAVDSDMSRLEKPPGCWVCGGRVHPYLHLGPVRVDACRHCDHLTMIHPPNSERGTDYHLAYDQTTFLTALEITRQRQAQDILAHLKRHAAASSILDYGCGRGFFLEACRTASLPGLAGADTSDLAISHLQHLGFESIRVQADNSLLSDFSALSFVPKTITFLDVIEHFADDMVITFAAWLDRLPKQTRTFVFKVPCRDGVLFRTSRFLARLGIKGPIKQLFQLGTWPPHLQYFSSKSLRLFVKNLGLTILEEWGDPDVEPGQLANRAASTKLLPRTLVSSAAHLMIGCGKTFGQFDSRIVQATRS